MTEYNTRFGSRETDTRVITGERQMSGPDPWNTRQVIKMGVKPFLMEKAKNMRLWEGQKNCEVKVLYDFPVGTDPVVSAIIDLKDDIRPAELEARAWLYPFIPIFDIDLAIKDLCRRYNINVEECFAKLGMKLERDGTFQLVRIRDGKWSCCICGVVFPTKLSGLDHVRSQHDIRDVIISPPWMIFHHVAANRGFKKIFPFDDERSYIMAISPPRGSEKVFPSLLNRNLRSRRSRDEPFIPVNVGFRNRARRLLSLESGTDFKIDQIVRSWDLSLLDTALLINSLKAADHPKLPQKKAGYPIIPTGLSAKGKIDYCRSTGRLLDTGLITIKGNKLDGSEGHKLLFENKKSTSSLFLLQTPEVTLEDLVLDKTTRKKIELATKCWEGLLSTVGGGRGEKKMGKYGRGVTLLLSGPPGTGKTFTAYSIAGSLDMKVIEAKISDVFDKFVGDTEKNLCSLFEKAEKTNAVLLIDEADAFVTKRGKTERASERYFNAEINVFLQELERFSGFAILTTNLKGNLDPALNRRVQFKVPYKRPDKAIRKRLWKKLMPDNIPLGDDVDYAELAKRFQFTGAQIELAIHNAVTVAYIAKNEGEEFRLSQNYFVEGAEIEMDGEGEPEEASVASNYIL